MEELYETKQIENMVLKYFVTRQERKESRTPLFGIKVVKLIGGRMEEELTGAVSEQEEPVRILIERLCNNKITPWVLNEVVDDLL